LGIIKPKRFFAEVNTIIKVGFAITQKKIIKSPLSRGDLGVCFIAIYSKNKVIPWPLKKKPNFCFLHFYVLYKKVGFFVYNYMGATLFNPFIRSFFHLFCSEWLLLLKLLLILLYQHSHKERGTTQIFYLMSSIFFVWENEP